MMSVLVYGRRTSGVPRDEGIFTPQDTEAPKIFKEPVFENEAERGKYNILNLFSRECLFSGAF